MLLKFEEMNKKVDAILKIQDFILNELPVLKNLPESIKGMINTQIFQSNQSSNPPSQNPNAMIQQALSQVFS
jgi:hypothetical protein